MTSIPLELCGSTYEDFEVYMSNEQIMADAAQKDPDMFVVKDEQDWLEEQEEWLNVNEDLCLNDMAERAWG